MNLNTRLTQLERNAEARTHCPYCNDGQIPAIVEVAYGESSNRPKPQPCSKCGKTPKHVIPVVNYGAADLGTPPEPNPQAIKAVHGSLNKEPGAGNAPDDIYGGRNDDDNTGPIPGVI